MKLFYGFALSLIFSVQASACLNQNLSVKGMTFTPIGRSVILNGASIEMLEFSSNQCGLECYMDFLNQKNVGFSKQGTLFYIEQKGGITFQLFENSLNRFSGRIICKAASEFKKISLPSYLQLPRPSTDFQAADKGSVSRTLVYPNFKKENYLNLIKILKQRSTSVDINAAYAYFEINNGDEINLIFDSKKRIGNLVLIYVNKRINS